MLGRESARLPARGLSRADARKIARRVSTKANEKVLVVAPEGLSSGWLAVTTWGLRGLPGTSGAWPQGTGAQEWIPWHQIESGQWFPEEETLGAWIVGGDHAVSWDLRADPRRLPVAFRERVDASVVMGRVVHGPGAQSVRVAIRRVAQTGDLVEQVIPARGTDLPETGSMRRQVEQTRAQMRDAVGLPAVGQ